MKAICGFVLTVLAGTAGAIAAQAATAPGDHYLCYKAALTGGPPFAKTSRALEDQLGGPQAFDVARVVSLCNPADKNGEGIEHPQVHQEGFSIKARPGAPRFQRQNHVTLDQFARRTVTILGPATLLDVTPKAPGTTPPAPFASDPTADPTVNRFKCYKARPAKGSDRFVAPLPPTIVDQFFPGGQRFELGRITKLCMPVDKQGETPGAELRDGHLLCYRAKLPRGSGSFAAQTVATHSSNFGPHVLRATAPAELCVPALKDPPPSSFSLASRSTGGPLAALGGPIGILGVPCGSILPGPAPKRIAADPSTLLDCAGLDIGGGTSALAEVQAADGTFSRFGVDQSSCSGGVCNVVGAPATGLAPGEDCTVAGCSFGAPQPIPNGTESLCVQGELASDATGSVDMGSGELSLTLHLLWHVWRTFDPVQPCPRCSASGTPAAPGSGTCNNGAQSGQPCLSTSSAGLTKGCPPASNADCTSAGVPLACCTGVDTGICGTNLGSVAVDLAPLGTGPSSAGNLSGDFCSGQAGAGTSGCFGASTIGQSCTSITDTGVPGLPFTLGVPADVTLASVFCLPALTAAGAGPVNSSLALPGPGALGAPYTITLQ